MADDLDEFLKQAALRRQQRQQQRGNREQSPPSKPQASPPPQSRMLEQQNPIPAAQVVNESKPYQPTIGNLSEGLPSASRTVAVDQADERMESHLKEVFQHEIGNLRPSESKTSNKKKGKKAQPRQQEIPRLQETQRLRETPATPAEIQPSAKVSSASLAAQLRDPQSLRMAIIAHEIMKRPWQ